MKRSIGQTMGLLFFVLLGAGLAPSGLFAQPAASTAFPRLDGDALAFQYAWLGQGGAYPWQELAEAALWASGVADPAAPRQGRGGQPQPSFSGMVLSAAVELSSSPALPQNLRERGEYVLSFMFEKFLKTYAENQTRLDEIFISGRYNCVSSAMLYTILATAVGLDVRGVMTRDHAFVTVSAAGEDIDVETTNPFGFDPGSRREFHDQFGRVTGFAYVPERNYRDRVFISQLELLSLILSNRIADLESRGRYSEAVPLALDRAILLSQRKDRVSSPFFSDPQKDLMDRIFNFGASLLKAGKETEALSWADRAERQFPEDSRWQEFFFAALNNRFIKLRNAQKIPEARETLSRYAPRLTPDTFNRLDALVVESELVGLSGRVSGAGNPEAARTALAAIDAAETRAVLSPARITEIRNFVILTEGERLKNAEGPMAAIAFTEAEIARYGGNSRLDEALRVFRSNRVAALHNAFADLFNHGDYTGAYRAVQAALAEFPGNRQLMSDLTLAEQAISQR
jgi:tetratricopeptide (TPR) repeat protein